MNAKNIAQKLKWMEWKIAGFADNIAIIAQDEMNLKSAFESLADILKNNYKIKLTGNKQKLCFVPNILDILILKRMTTP